jgi:hypothetical protein
MESLAAWERDEPLLAHPELVTEVESDKTYELHNHGDPSCFRIDLVKRWLEDRVGPFTYRVADGWGPHRGLLPLSLEHVQGVNELTQLWINERRLYVVGPNAETLADLLVPHSAINANSIVGVLREDLRVRNPFRADEFAKLISDGRNKGLALSKTIDAYRAVLATEPRVAVLAPDRDRENAAREFLREISNREWNFIRPIDWSPSSHAFATLPLWFRRAADAPLVVFSADPSFDLWAVASMGAGRVLRIRAKRFSATTPVALTVTDSKEIDGGDVHIWWSTSYDEMLDGESLTSCRHRREAATAETDDD